MDAWSITLTVVSSDRTARSESRALARDVERNRRVRLRQGVYVDHADWTGLKTAEERHVVAARAFDAVASEPPVFSHATAAVLHGLPVLDRRLDRVHVTVPDAGRRGHNGVAGHVFRVLPSEVTDIRRLLVTTVPRTVVDVAGAWRFEEGVVVADAALALSGSGGRGVLVLAAAMVEPRRAEKRIDQVIAFADGRSGSPGESISRVTIERLGIERPVLQHPVFDRAGRAGDLDFWFPTCHVGGEFDGLVKYLDPRYAKEGAGRVVYNEKRREDRVRACIDGLARWGWIEAGSTTLLRPILATAGVRPLELVRR